LLCATPQDLVLVLRAYGTLKHQPANTSFLALACEQLHARRRRLQPLQMALGMKAFAEMGWQPDSTFMDDMAGAALSRIELFKPMELSQLLWGYAMLGYRHVPLYEGIVLRLQLHLEASPQRVLPRAALESVLHCCDRVGFWPTSLLDEAEAMGALVGTAATSQSRRPEQANVAGAPPPAAFV